MYSLGYLLGGSVINVSNSEKTVVEFKEPIANPQWPCLTPNRLFLSSKSGKVPILYGGSANEKNCAEIMSINDVGGLLVGGASLKAREFMEISQT